MPAKSKYTPETVQTICEALARGETAIAAATLAGVSESQYYEWLNIKPEFSEAVKTAKEQYAEWERNQLLADAKKSLMTLINGMDYEEVTTEYEPDRHGEPKIKKQTRKSKKIPPSAAAIIFALTNRDPDNWKNRLAQDISGKVETATKTDVSLSNIPDDLLEQVIEAIAKR